jgi:hypothetical protein
MPSVNTGLHARAGFEVNAAWENGKIARSTIRRLAGDPASVRLGARTAKLQMKAGESVVLDGELKPAGGSAFQDETNILEHELAIRRSSGSLAAVGQCERHLVQR